MRESTFGDAAPSPAAVPFDPPQGEGEIGRFGKYRVLKQLGRGGMGAVFAAEHVHLGERHALKFIVPGQATHPDARARFFREAQAARKVDSPHVVKVFDADEHRGVLYIAMELLHGQELGDYLEKKGPPPISQAVRIGREMAEGLAAAHAVGLVHRDIKPQNVWLEAPTGRVKLLDFGIAADTLRDTRLTRPGQGMGTAEYMAPEQVDGARGVDHRADLFSLGAVLFQLVTGVSPFRREGYIPTIGAVIAFTPDPPSSLRPNVPPAFNDLILRLLAKKREDRPGTAREVADALAAFLGGMRPAWELVVESRPPAFSEVVPVPLDTPHPLGDPPYRRERQRSSFRPLAVVGVVLCVAVLVGLGGILLALAVGDLPRLTQAVNTGVQPTATAPPTFRGVPAPTQAPEPKPAPKSLPPTTPTSSAPKSAPALLKAPFSSAEAKAAQQAWAAYLGRPVNERIDLGGGVKLELVLIPPGTFTMGSPDKEENRNTDEEAHPVTIAKPFYLGKYEVLQTEYKVVMAGAAGVDPNPSQFKGDRQPVDTVSHADAEAFCGRLKFPGGRPGLPSEAQWEYACRSGTTTPFHFGAVLNGEQACCDGSVPYGTDVKGTGAKQTCDVGRYAANAFGLHDTHGNVWEWCADWSGPYSAVADAEIGQKAMNLNQSRMLRGGSWDIGAWLCRAASRHWAAPGYSGHDFGFRVAVRLD